MTRLVDAKASGALREAAAALADGAVVAVPTDTVYGLAVDPAQPDAVERLFALKGRPADVPLPILVAGPEQVAQVAGHLEVAAQALAERYWPGPLTLVVPRRPGFTVDLGGPAAARQTVGVRRPDHPVVVALCEMLGPLAVTSANLHGEEPATSAPGGGPGLRRVRPTGDGARRRGVRRGAVHRGRVPGSGVALPAGGSAAVVGAPRSRRSRFCGSARGVRFPRG